MNVEDRVRGPGRRAFLRGACGALALPWLERYAPRRERAAARQRFVVVYVPNGMHMAAWTPAEPGALPEDLPPILRPLARWRERMLVLSGLAHDKARANGDGPGDHARAAAAFLTAAQPRKTSGRDLRAGTSIDQVLAASIGATTPFASLELAGERGRQSGECDSGYACVYSHNLAWRTPELPLPPETDPRQLFDRLFAGGDRAEERAQRAEVAAQRRSLLDYLRDDARSLSQQLGAADRRKLELYLDSVRELERKIASLDAEDDAVGAAFAGRRPERADGFEARSLALAEVLALALAADRTRVATWMVANEGSNRSYPSLGVKDGHHEISHHGGDEAKQRAIERINVFQAGLVAHLLRALERHEEEGASLLEHTTVLYGSGIADGNSHAHHGLPLALFGGTALRLRGGRHLRFSGETPVANLFLALAERYGVELERFGDSTGRLPELG
ncbi:MAG: DUF1552 domain-containing protein [Planctomycetes bacterium]|nr:DUF1552 domain-containing protein [Planctomycetota bacterium]